MNPSERRVATRHELPRTLFRWHRRGRLCEWQSLGLGFQAADIPGLPLRLHFGAALGMALGTPLGASLSASLSPALFPCFLKSFFQMPC